MSFRTTRIGIPSRRRLLALLIVTADSSLHNPPYIAPVETSAMNRRSLRLDPHRTTCAPNLSRQRQRLMRRQRSRLPAPATVMPKDSPQDLHLSRLLLPGGIRRVSTRPFSPSPNAGKPPPFGEGLPLQVCGRTTLPTRRRPERPSRRGKPSPSCHAASSWWTSGPPAGGRLAGPKRPCPQ